MFLLLSAFYSRATNNNYRSIADSANKAYTEGQYYYAIELYDSILKDGYASAALYYNMGNAYFKTNQLPYAILYYEKAKKLSPADNNINYNLKLANTLITDKIDEIPLLFYQRWWQGLYNSFSADTWAKIAIACMFLVFVCLAIYLISNILIIKKTSFFIFALFLIVTIFSLIFAKKQNNLTFNDKAGIVFSPRITAKSSPDENSIDLFVIHEGTKVFINDKLGEWYEIKLANGSVGWIKKSTIKPI